MIKKCTCVNKYQDQRYGINNRVHNPCGGVGKNTSGWRCTVCGTKKGT